MNIFRKIILLFWPRNTWIVASLQWQAQENRRVAARQRLEGQYLATRRHAEQVSAATQQGILRAARMLLAEPPDPGMERVQDRLQKAFARRGRGFCRRVPEPLQLELRLFSAAVKKIRRDYGAVEARLKLAQEIIKVFAGNPEFCRARFFRLALISPESAWLLFQLRHQRLKDRRAMEDYLSEKLSTAH